MIQETDQPPKVSATLPRCLPPSPLLFLGSGLESQFQWLEGWGAPRVASTLGHRYRKPEPTTKEQPWGMWWPLLPLCRL